MARWRPDCVATHGSVLLGKVRTPLNPLMEEVDSCTLTVTVRSTLDLSIRPPTVSVCSCLRVSVVQILSPIWLLLSTWWSLPLFKLLKSKAVNIVNWYYRLSTHVSYQILQFVLDLWLLLLKIF